jgi:hypothetical protein
MPNNWWETPANTSHGPSQQTPAQTPYIPPAQQPLNNIPSSYPGTSQIGQPESPYYRSTRPDGQVDVSTLPPDQYANQGWADPNALVSPYSPGLVYNPQTGIWAYGQGDYASTMTQQDYESQFVNPFLDLNPNVIRGAVPLSQATWNTPEWLTNPINERPSWINVAPNGRSVASVNVPYNWGQGYQTPTPPVAPPTTPPVVTGGGGQGGPTDYWNPAWGPTPGSPGYNPALVPTWAGGTWNEANSSTPYIQTPNGTDLVPPVGMDTTIYDDLPRAPGGGAATPNTTPAGDDASFWTGFSDDLPPGYGQPGMPGDPVIYNSAPSVPVQQQAGEGTNPLSALLSGQMNRAQYNPLMAGQEQGKTQGQFPSWIYSLMPYIKEMGRSRQ